MDRLNLRVRQGELFGLLGPNGAGKTTLIKLLSTMILPTSGSATVNGYPLTQEGAIRATTGLATTDERSFFWRLSGRQNLEFFAALHGLKAPEAGARVEEVLRLTGLEEAAAQTFQAYSTGMRQRLSIARALLSRPALLFLDEPSKGLDPQAVQRLHALILDLVRRQGITVFLTTHNLEEARLLCDRVAILHQGRIRACGTLSELRGLIQPVERYSILIRDVRETLVARLQEAFPQGQARLNGQVPAPGSGLLEVSAAPGDGVLDVVFGLLHREGVGIQSIRTQEVTLEQVFAQVIAAPSGESLGYPQDPPQAEPISQPQFSPAAEPAARRPAPRSRAPGFLQSAWAFLKRDFRIEASYRFAFFMQFFGIFFNLTLFYFIAQLFGEAAAPYLSAYGGDYFSFVLIGIAFTGYFSAGLSSFSSTIRHAQTSGTLEAMLVTPTPLASIVLSSSLWTYLLTTLRVGVYLGLGAGLLGVPVAVASLLPAVLVLLLTILAFASIGIIAASFTMVLKRGDPIAWLFGVSANLIGGVYYPVEVLPGWLQSIAEWLPVTHALRALRLALLQGAPIWTLAPDLLALAAFAAVLLPLSMYAFRFAVRRAKIEGSLTHF